MRHAQHKGVFQRFPHGVDELRLQRKHIGSRKQHNDGENVCAGAQHKRKRVRVCLHDAYVRVKPGKQREKYKRQHKTLTEVLRKRGKEHLCDFSVFMADDLECGRIQRGGGSTDGHDRDAAEQKQEIKQHQIADAADGAHDRAFRPKRGFCHSVPFAAASRRSE